MSRLWFGQDSRPKPGNQLRGPTQRPEMGASASPHTVTRSPGSGLLSELNADCDPIRKMGFSWLGKIFKHLGPYQDGR